jgi:hypothetical protein
MTTGPRIYNLFPLLCGTIKNWHGELSRIAAMKFDWIFLNPHDRHEALLDGSTLISPQLSKLPPGASGRGLPKATASRSVPAKFGFSPAPLSQVFDRRQSATRLLRPRPACPKGGPPAKRLRMGP